MSQPGDEAPLAGRLPCLSGFGWRSGVPLVTRSRSRRLSTLVGHNKCHAIHLVSGEPMKYRWAIIYSKNACNEISQSRSLKFFRGAAFSLRFTCSSAGLLASRRNFVLYLLTILLKLYHGESCERYRYWRLGVLYQQIDCPRRVESNT
jgi:hypothetical protein